MTLHVAEEKQAEKQSWIWAWILSWSLEPHWQLFLKHALK